MFLSDFKFCNTIKVDFVSYLAAELLYSNLEYYSAMYGRSAKPDFSSFLFILVLLKLFVFLSVKHISSLP
jgi:hypothetical protein